MTSYNKLVRDKVPEILDAKGVSYEKRIASVDEYKIELEKKLREEIDEFVKNPSVDELADILEVVDALKVLPDYSNVQELQVIKREERGGFNDRIILKGEKN